MIYIIREPDIKETGQEIISYHERRLMSEAAVQEQLNGQTFLFRVLPPVDTEQATEQANEQDGTNPSYQGRQKKGVGTRTVQPYESFSQIMKILDYLEYWDRYRDYALIMTGLSTGLRISDLVRLDVKHVYDTNIGQFRKVIDINEKKTGKSTITNLDEMVITDAMIMALTKYFDYIKWDIHPDDPLFKSDRMSKDGTFYLSECQGWRIVKQATEDAKVNIKAGSHTLRKTFLNIANAVGTTSRLGNGNGMVLSDVMVLARHSKITTTLRYTSLMKSRLISLRKGVSAFLLGKTQVKSLKMEYSWDGED